MLLMAVKYILNIYMQQKALLKNFCHLDKQDWSLIHQPNVTILVNNHTSD